MNWSGLEAMQVKCEVFGGAGSAAQLKYRADGGTVISVMVESA
jgi:hypothetical protein